MRKFKNSNPCLPMALRMFERPCKTHQPYWNVVVAPRMSRPKKVEDKIMRLGQTSKIHRYSFLKINPVLWSHLKRPTKAFKKASPYLFVDAAYNQTANKRLNRYTYFRGPVDFRQKTLGKKD